MTIPVVDGIGSFRPMVTKKLDQIGTLPGACGEMDPARAVAGVGGNHDLVLQPPLPLLCNQRMDLAGGVQADKGYVVADMRSRTAACGQRLLHFGLGGLKQCCFWELAGHHGFGSICFKQQSKRWAGVSAAGSSWGVQEGDSAPERADTPAPARGGEFWKTRRLFHIPDDTESSEPKKVVHIRYRTGTPPRQKRGGRRWMQTVTADQQGVLWNPGGYVVVQKHCGCARKRRLGAGAKIGHDQSTHILCTQFRRHIRRPDILSSAEQPDPGILPAAVESAGQDGCRCESIGVMMAEDQHRLGRVAGCQGFAELLAARGHPSFIGWVILAASIGHRSTTPLPCTAVITLASGTKRDSAFVSFRRRHRQELWRTVNLCPLSCPIAIAVSLSGNEPWHIDDAPPPDAGGPDVVSYSTLCSGASEAPPHSPGHGAEG